MIFQSIFFIFSNFFKFSFESNFLNRKALKKILDPKNNFSQINKEMNRIKLQTDGSHVLEYIDLFQENMYCFYISEHCEVLIY